jgi:hypothetical protein
LELRTHKVSDLSSAITTSNELVDFDVVASKGDAGASKMSSKFKNKDEIIKKRKCGGGEPNQAANNRRSEGKAKEKGLNPNVCCFIYEGITSQGMN